MGGGVENLNITAVEINPKIAELYKKLFPDDNVIVGDAHEFLRANFRDYDFIWASPPCPTHSVLQMNRYYDKDLKYPDMTLYQEIIWLKTFYKGAWCIENVIPYYEPLVSPTFKIDRHYFWCNKYIMVPMFNDNYTSMRDDARAMADAYGYDIEVLKSCKVECRQVLRNLVFPEIGKYIFENLTAQNVR